MARANIDDSTDPSANTASSIVHNEFTTKNIVADYKCTSDGPPHAYTFYSRISFIYEGVNRSFVGTGTNKKAAKENASAKVLRFFEDPKSYPETLRPSKFIAGVEININSKNLIVSAEGLSPSDAQENLDKILNSVDDLELSEKKLSLLCKHFRYEYEKVSSNGVILKSPGHDHSFHTIDEAIGYLADRLP